MRSSEMPLLEFYRTYDQWKEEHDDLHARLIELCRFLTEKPAPDEHTDWDARHRLVRDTFLPFMEDWLRHLSRERATIYPFAQRATCGGAIGPIPVLEQDQRIVDQFYESYLIAAYRGESAEELLSRLLQVLMVIAEHFRVEDETVLPATEKLMDEIEYSGS